MHPITALMLARVVEDERRREATKRRQSLVREASPRADRGRARRFSLRLPGLSRLAATKA